MIWHPRKSVLQEYMDGELDGHRRAGVSAHLARCTRCRRRIAAWRAAADALRIAPVPQFPADLYERVLGRLDSGERVILPLAAAASVQRRPVLQYTAVAAAMVLIALATVFGTPDARADASELRFLPEKPLAGAEIQVEYQSSSVLASHDQLVLRIRFRAATNQPYHDEEVVAVELRKGRNSSFSGTFQLPDSAVFAIVAVEDMAGTVVDSRSQRGWELLVHGADGRPLLAALVQRINDLHGRNWEVAHAVAREAVQHYPDAPRAWSTLRFLDSQLHGAVANDSIRTIHSRHFMRLHGKWSGDPNADADDLNWLAFYGLSLEPELAASWRARLLRQYPLSSYAVQFRTADVLMQNQADPVRVLSELEALWEEAGPAHEIMVTAGLHAAQRTDDAHALMRWTDRTHYFKRFDEYQVTRNLLNMPALRDEGIRRIQEQLAYLESGDQRGRPLFRTVPAHQAATAAHIRSLSAVLGGALLARGDSAAAMMAFDRAVDGGWNPQLFRDVASARLAAGDSIRALELFAFVVADPGTGSAFADSTRLRLGAAFDQQLWQDALTAGQARMRSVVLASSTVRSIRGRVRLVDDAGQTADLSSLAVGVPTVLVFWSRFCAPAVEAAPMIQRVAEQVAGRGARMLLIVDEPRSDGLRSRLAELGLQLPVYYDVYGEAANAISVWGTPAYFILDASGRVRFDHTGLGAIERQVAVISQ